MMKMKVTIQTQTEKAEAAECDALSCDGLFKTTVHSLFLKTMHCI